MRRDKVGIVRAHLRTAAITAMLMQAGQLIGMGLLGTSEAVFQTAGLRLLAAATILSFVELARLASYMAYGDTKAMRRVRTDAHHDNLIYRRSDAALRFPSRLHYCFMGRPKGGERVPVVGP